MVFFFAKCQKWKTVLNSAGDQIQRFQSVLRDFAPLLAKLQNQRQRTAARFNVFDALDLDEPAHSRFIAYLLNPTKHHDQGDIFLISFLKCLGLNFCRSSTQDAEVNGEFNLDPHSRIDIHIRLANGQITLVENKIGAPEDTDQIAKYQDWLQCQESSPKFRHHLVFLTPDGHTPSSARRSEDVICLSYSDLSNWIESSSRFSPERLRLVLEQYAEICRQIGESTNKGACMPDEIRQFLLGPERLETALQIEAILPDVKKCLFQTFWDQVQDKMKRLMKENGHDQLWKVCLSDDIFEDKWSSLDIVWRASDPTRRFSVYVESITKGSFVNYGITRGIRNLESARRDRRDKDLIVNLGQNGFSPRYPDSYWVACRRFGEENQALPTFNIEHAGDVLKLGREMLDEEKPLTKQVVRLIWKLFCDFREPLEDLNQNYPNYDNPAEP